MFVLLFCYGHVDGTVLKYNNALFSIIKPVVSARFPQSAHAVIAPGIVHNGLKCEQRDFTQCSLPLTLHEGQSMYVMCSEKKDFSHVAGGKMVRAARNTLDHNVLILN